MELGFTHMPIVKSPVILKTSSWGMETYWPLDKLRPLLNLPAVQVGPLINVPVWDVPVISAEENVTVPVPVPALFAVSR